VFELAKAKAITGKEVIELLQPPHTQELLDAIDRRELAQAEFLQAHPEAISHGKAHKK
jgi:hypothetical protein